MPGNSVARPAVAVMEFNVNEITVNPLIRDLVSISTIANRWAGGRYESAVKRRCQASSGDKVTIYLPYKDLGNFTFTGSGEVIGRLIDRI